MRAVDEAAELLTGPRPVTLSPLSRGGLGKCRLAIAKTAIRKAFSGPPDGARSLQKRSGVKFRVHIAEPAKERLEALPAPTVDRLTNHIKAIAELADLWPILYSGEDVGALLLNVGDLEIRYAVDVENRELTVNGIVQLGTAP